MAVFSGPEIVNDGLVFHYDMGNTEKSWKGKPTTNELTNLDLSSWTKDNGCTVISTGEFYQGQPVYRATFPTGTLPRFRWNFDYTDGQTFTGSFYYKYVVNGNTNPNFYFREVNFGSVYNSSNLTETDGRWHFKQMAHTFSGSGTCMFLIYFPTASSTGTASVVDFCMPQVEQNSFATPFVNGTRSNTEAVRDLTGNNTITANSLTYNSDGTFEFDNTKIITSPMTNLRPTAQITQECWVNINTNIAQVFIGAQYGSGSNNSYAIWLSAANTWAAGVNIGGTFNYSTYSQTVTTGVYYHFVHTYDGANQNMYINGNLVKSWATTGSVAYDTNNTLLAIGNDWNSGYDGGASIGVRGKMPVCKIYNRALSATEIQQNFEAVRTRFGI